jgi:hypothetical protein
VVHGRDLVVEFLPFHPCRGQFRARLLYPLRRGGFQETHPQLVLLRPRTPFRTYCRDLPYRVRQRHHSVDPYIQALYVYHNWPGFFGLAALFSTLISATLAATALALSSRDVQAQSTFFEPKCQFLAASPVELAAGHALPASYDGREFVEIALLSLLGEKSE